jgi:uncharacterized protein (DUF1501 family)
MHVNRRDFLRKSLCAALGGVGLYSAFGNLRLVAAAANARGPRIFADYRALVCIYLYGGNDSFNTVVPISGSAHTDYLASRGELALTTGLQALNAVAGGAPSDGSNYGLHPSMPELAELFNSGKAAVVANVGSLLYPITQAQYQNGTVPTPAQLYSHDDQTTQWQTSRPDDANADGWGGRIADLLYASNSGQIPMSISLDGANRFQRGAIVSPYSMNPDGVTEMNYLGNGPESWVSGGVDPASVAAYSALMAGGTQAHVLERAFANSANSAIANYGIIAAALDGVADPAGFPDSDLGNQLKMVAKLISVRAALGMSRQVFIVSMGNYDTHSDQLSNQSDNLAELSQALAAFTNATAALGVGDGVTAFTASDFGRSLPVNSTGTDHGWGGHHFVVGGGVSGQRFFGTMPSLGEYDDDNPGGNPDDTGYGQIIPTLAVDQYAATLARWFGVDDGGIGDIFPNLGRFGSGNLGFMG